MPNFSRARWRWTVFAGGLAVLGIALGGGHLVGVRREGDLRDRWRALLGSAADARGAALARWVAEAWLDAAAIAGFPTVRYLVNGPHGSDTPFPAGQGPESHLAEILSRFAPQASHRRVWLLDGAGGVVASSHPAPEPSEITREAARLAVERRQPSLRIGRGSQGMAAAFSAPVTTRGPGAVAAVVITEDLAAYVFPLLSLSNAYGTTELLLVEQRGDVVVYLSPLRKKAPSPAPLKALSPPGLEGPREFTDYSGVPVLAVVRHLGVSGLSLVAQVDLSEALGPAYREGAFAAAALLGAGAALGFLAHLLLRRSREVHALELASSEARAALILDNMNDAVLFTDADFRIVDANRAAERLYGRSRQQLLCLSTVELRSPETRAASAAALAEIRRENQAIFETEHVHQDGTRFPVEVAVRGMQVSGRQMYLGLVRDLRERKRAAESLTLAIEAANLGTWDWDLRGGQLVWGGHHAEIFGFAPGEFDGRYETFLQRVHLEDRALVSARVEESRLQRRECQCEYRVLWPDGSTHWVFGRGRFDYDEAGEAIRMRGAILETTARRKAEDELRKLFRAIEQSPVSVVITDATGRIEYVNPCFSEVTGYTREEALGQNPRLVKSGQHGLEFYEQMWATLLSGSEWRGQIQNKRKDGRSFTEDAVISPVTDDEGRITHFIGVKQDVTEQRRREEALRASRTQLIQAQKMEALGRLAGGMAHDFNNLLGVILGYAELVLRRLTGEDPVHHKVEEIVKAAERAAGLTRQLLAYSRKQVLAPTVVDLNSVLQELSRMLSRLLGEDVELVLEPGADVGRVRVDRGQIEQVVMNLAVNARDAMPGGGRLSLATSNEQVSEDDPRRRGLMPPGRYVRLAIADTGAGMNPEVLSHLFEPFFTTKEHGKGTGLGLSTVYGIVKQSDGFIWVESAPEQGTTFEIFLPAVEAAATATVAAPAPRRGAHQWVLILEDNDTLRALEREILAQAGYRVLDAADGDAALAIVRGHAEPIALLLSDVILPKRGGLEVAAEIGTLRPGTRMLFTSGYTADMAGVQKVLDAGHAFLPKPATPEALLAKVAEVLAR